MATQRLGSDRLMASLLELAGILLSEEAVQTVMNHVVELSIRTLDGAHHAGITLMRTGRATTQASSNPFVEEIDDLQYETGEGPCLESIRTGAMFYVNCTPEEERWKAFCELAARHGVGSVLSFPLRAREHALGALNLYSMEIDGFSDEDRDMALIFAAQASIAVTNAQLYDDSKMLVDNLYDALASRAVIDQAKGIIIEREACTPEEAFEALKKASQDSNVKLRDISARLVDSAQVKRGGGD